MAFWTIFFCSGTPSSPAGSDRKSSKPNHRDQLLGGIVALPAPPAAGLPARCVAKLLDNLGGLGKIEQHPWRHDRVGAGHRQPGEDVGQGPALLSCIIEDRTYLYPAALGTKPPLDGLLGLFQRRPGGPPHGGEDQVEARSILGVSQPVPGGQQFRRGFSLACSAGWRMPPRPACCPGVDR